MSVLVFGEILWDLFGDEAKIGGAPFNFGVHLCRLGEPVSLVTAVGQDSLGEKALERMKTEGMDTALVGLSPLPTGYCRVTLDNGAPRYDLKRPVAYDDIHLSPENLTVIRKRRPRALYFGSLSQRAETSRHALRQLLSLSCYEEIFCDINIRPPFYSPEVLEACLKSCTILKISREEAKILSDSGLLVPFIKDYSGPEALCQTLAHRYSQLKLVLVTLDKDGAMAYDAQLGRVLYSQKPQSRLISAVGAGDSFAACFLFHYLRAASLEICLENSVRLSDYVVTRLEATPELPEELKRAVGASV